MKSPPARSLTEDGTGFERRLLESARGDGIPAAARERLARALSVAGAAPVDGRVPSRASSPAAFARLAAFPKPAAFARLDARAKWRAVTSRAARWGVCGLVGAAAAAMGAQRWLGENAATGSAPAEIEVSAPAVRAPVAVAPVASAVASPAPETVLPAPELSAPVPPPKAAAAERASARASSARTVPPPASPGKAGGSSREGGLRAELRAVEAIQQALRAGRAGDAERGLDDYSRRFPRGELAIEAELLRIDLDVARGDRAGARARARALIARPDAARYRERLEALTRD